MLLGGGRGPRVLAATTSLIAMTILVARSPLPVDRVVHYLWMKRLTTLCRRLSRASRTSVSDMRTHKPSAPMSPSTAARAVSSDVCP